MKWRYRIFLMFLFLILILSIWILKQNLEFSNWITASATIGGAIVALAVGIIAIGIADKPLRFVEFTVKTEVDKEHILTYKPADLPNELKRGNGNNPFHSYRVYFKIKNKSKFTLKNPATTFRLPTDFTPPHKKEDNTWVLSYRSNIYNVQKELRYLAYEDTIVLSNIMLPFLNSEQELPIWIRMCLSKDDTKPRYVYVDLNCDNAEGATKKIRVIPKDFLKDI